MTCYSIRFGNHNYILHSTTLTKEQISGGTPSDLARWERLAYGGLQLAMNKNLPDAIRAVENALGLIRAQRGKNSATASISNGLIVG